MKQRVFSIDLPGNPAISDSASFERLHKSDENRDVFGGKDSYMVAVFSTQRFDIHCMYIYIYMCTYIKAICCI